MTKNETLIKDVVSLTDTIRNPDYTCNVFTFAKTESAIKELKQTIEKNKSFVLIYRQDLRWIVEKDITKGLSIIKDSKSNNIGYCFDKIVISRVPYPDVKYAVILH